MFKSIALVLFLVFGFSVRAADKIKVITTLPDLAEVVRAVGGDKVEVDSLLKGTEDAHFLEAVPTLV